MDTQVDRRPRSGEEKPTEAGVARASQVDFLNMAARYLQLALEDRDLSDDEEAVLLALHDVPKDTQTTSTAAALSRYVASAQASAQRMTPQERALIVELAHLLKQHPQADLPGLAGLLDLINNIVNNGTPDRHFTAPEAQVVSFVLDVVRSGQLNASAVDHLLALSSRLALEGASLFDSVYSGLTDQDAAQIRKEAQAAGFSASPAPATPVTTPPPAPPPTSNEFADRYHAAAMADGQLSPEESTLHQALLKLPPQKLGSETSSALLRFVLICQNTDQQISTTELSFIQRIIDTLRINPSAATPGLLELIQLFIDVLTNACPERAPTPEELAIFARALTLVRSGQHDLKALSCVFNTIERLAMEGSHLYYGIYSGLGKEDLAAFNAAAPTPGSTSSNASGAAQAAESAAAGAPNTALAAALKSGASALREGAAVLDQLASGNIPPEGADSALAHIASARAALAPFVAKKLPNALATNEQLSTLDNVLRLALATTEPDLRLAMQDQFGDLIDPTALAQLPVDTLVELPPLDPSVLRGLLKTGMALADAIRLAPNVSPDEIQRSSFTSMLHERLQKGDPADDALLWARYQGLASDAELAHAQFRADLTEARHLHPDLPPTQHVHEARCLALYRHLGALVPLDAIRSQEPKVVQALLAHSPAILKPLLEAGTSLADTAALAASITPEEVQSAEFLQVLTNKLKVGLTPQQAITWARFSAVASPDELNDPQFIQDLIDAPAKGYGDSKTSALFYARACLLARRLAPDVNLQEILKLPGATINQLLATAPDTIKQFLGLGVTLTQFGALSNEQRDALLSADINIVTALFGAGMKPADVASYAGTVVTANELSPEWIEKLRSSLAQGASGGAAIASARYGDLISPKELASPDFLHNLLFPSESGIPPSQGALALSLISTLGRASELAGVFLQANIPFGEAETGEWSWFYDPNSEGWNSFSSWTLESCYSQDERNAVIQVAKEISDNWSTLSALGYTKDDVWRGNVAPLIAMLGNTPSTVGGTSMNIVSALDYLRQHLDVFEAAEQVATSSANPHDGQFANSAVSELASLAPDSSEWAQIETILGRAISPEDRSSTVAAAKGTIENWATLCANAGTIRLGLREGTTDAIDFTSDNLGQLNFAPLVGLLSQPLATDRLHTLQYARAQSIVQHFSDAQGKPATGADLQTALGLSLSPDQSSRLLALDPEAARTLLARGAPLPQLAELIPEQLPPLMAVDPDLLSWLINLVGANASEISKLTGPAIKQLQAEKLAGHRPAAGDEVITDIKPESIGYPMELAGGALAFETQSGQKIIVTKHGNPSLFNQALGLLLERSQQKVQELRDQNGLPPEPDVNVSELPTTVPVNPDDLNAGFYTVSELALKNLMDSYRGGFVMRHGTASTNGTVVTYQLDDGSQLVVDKNRLKTDSAKQTFDKLVAGQPVSEGELRHLASDDGSENLFDGDDWDTWMGFTTQIASSDPRTQLARAMESRNALANGYQLLPFYINPDDYRSYPGGQDNPTLQTVTPADLRDILNEGTVNNRIAELMANPAIQADYQAALSSALNNLPNRQEIADSLYSTLTGPQYIKTLRDFKDQDLCYEAEQMTQRDLSALAMLDPARALDAAQKLRINSLSADFQELVSDPSKIDEATFETATNDSLQNLLVQLLRSSSGMVRHGSNTLIEIVKNLQPADVASLSKVIRDFVIRVQTQNDKSINLNDLTGEQFKEALERNRVPLERRGTLTRFFTQAQLAGVWGTIAGGGALAAFGYKLSKGAWGPGSDFKERWGAARDLISFLSVQTHLLKTVAKGTDALLNTQTLKTGVESLDALLNRLMPGPNHQRVWKFLGLDQSDRVWQLFGLHLKDLKAIWNEGSRPSTPHPNTAGAPASNSAIADALETGMAQQWLEYEEAADRIPAEISDELTQHLIPQQAELSAGVIDAPKPLAAMKTLGRRVALSVIKVLSTVTDLVGVADIIMGARDLKDSIQAGDPALIAANSLTIGGGLALAGAGTIGTLGLFTTLPAIIGAAAAPLFLVGTVLALGSFIAALFSGGAMKRYEELNRSADQQAEWFQNLANDGLARADWGDKLEYLRYAYAWYGNDNTDPNRSYFSFQQAEWDYFHNTPQENGSSLKRLNDGLHVRTEKTWETPYWDPSDTGMGIDM